MQLMHPTVTSGTVAGTVAAEAGQLAAVKTAVVLPPVLDDVVPPVDVLPPVAVVSSPPLPPVPLPSEVVMVQPEAKATPKKLKNRVLCKFRMCYRSPFKTNGGLVTRLDRSTCSWSEGQWWD